MRRNGRKINQTRKRSSENVFSDNINDHTYIKIYGEVHEIAMATITRIDQMCLTQECEQAKEEYKQCTNKRGLAEPTTFHIGTVKESREN